jgi:hypothetical protein
MCQLWPLVVSLGLNKLPLKRFTLFRSRIKKIRRHEQGDCQCKMASILFHSVVANRAPIPGFASNRLTPCKPFSSVLRFATIGMTHWQSALKFRLLTVAICGTIIFFVAIPDLNTVVYDMVCGTQLSAVYHKESKSSTSHFISTIPCLMHHLFSTRYLTGVDLSWVS